MSDDEEAYAQGFRDGWLAGLLWCKRWFKLVSRHGGKEEKPAEEGGRR